MKRLIILLILAAGCTAQTKAVQSNEHVSPFGKKPTQEQLEIYRLHFTRELWVQWRLKNERKHLDNK